MVIKKHLDHDTVKHANGWHILPPELYHSLLAMANDCSSAGGIPVCRQKRVYPNHLNKSIRRIDKDYDSGNGLNKGFLQ